MLLPVLLSCNPGEVTPDLKPAMRLSVVDSDARSVTLKVESVNATVCKVLCMEEGKGSPAAQQILSDGVSVNDGLNTIRGFEPNTNYTAYSVAADASGKTSSIASAGFSTHEGAGFLYDWELKRTELPRYSNMALLYGGSRHRDPFNWDKERCATHVTYTDRNGKEHWLFDAFLAIEFVSTQDNMSYMLGHGKASANKKSWEHLLDYWFARDNGFAELDKAVGDAIGRLGLPPTKRKVVMVMPDPIIYYMYNDPKTTTAYWGFLGDRQMDFRLAADRLAAMRWYIDEVRRRWNEGGYDNLEFAGFYTLSEDLALPTHGWSAELKRWEDIYPEITKYIHSCNESTNWIPYNNAGGHIYWKEFGMDYAMMQPNYIWHAEYNMNDYMNIIRKTGFSMEIEIDDNVLTSTAGYEAYRARVQKYYSMCKELDLYGKRELSYYMGGDTLYKLYMSTDPADKDFYHEFCSFVIGSIH